MDVEILPPKRIQRGRLIDPRVRLRRVPLAAETILVEAVQDERVFDLVRGVVGVAGTVVIAPAYADHVADKEAAIDRGVGSVEAALAVTRFDALAAVEENAASITHFTSPRECVALVIGALKPVVLQEKRRDVGGGGKRVVSAPTPAVHNVVFGETKNRVGNREVSIGKVDRVVVIIDEAPRLAWELDQRATVDRHPGAVEFAARDRALIERPVKIDPDVRF